MVTGETKLLLCEQRSLQSRAWEVGWVSTVSPWLRWDDHCILLDQGVDGEHLDNGDVRVDWADDLPARTFQTDLGTYENPIILELDESKLKKIDREARAWWWGSWGQALGRWVVFNDFMIQLCLLRHGAILFCQVEEALKILMAYCSLGEEYQAGYVHGSIQNITAFSDKMSKCQA